MELTRTKLEYYDDMWKLQSESRLISISKGLDGRVALILDSTIFHPQGGGQPADTGIITGSDFKFIVQDVRSLDGIVHHFGAFEDSTGSDLETLIGEGRDVLLLVDEPRRKLNSRLHSAGHLLDVCMQKVGLGHLEPGKGYHFPDGPFVEYRGTIPQNELQTKQTELELEASALISAGGRVFASVLSYEEAAELCGGTLPDYIPKVSENMGLNFPKNYFSGRSKGCMDLVFYIHCIVPCILIQGSTPRVVKLGDNPGCPCGGTHVSDISEITSLKVSQIRSKKGMTKVFYTAGA